MSSWPGWDSRLGKGSWYRRYKAFFLERFGIDWEKSPVPLHDIEEINVARNDIQHQGDWFRMKRPASDEHKKRFPFGIFLSGWSALPEEAIQKDEIFINDAALKEAIRRVKSFCEYLEDNRRH